MTTPRAYSAEDDPERVLDFFQAIYEDAPGYAIFECGQLILGDNGKFDSKKWHAHAFKWPDQAPQLLELLAGRNQCAARTGVGWNLYYCPTLFNQPKRIKDYAVLTPWLWADLDEAAPSTFPETVPPPTIVVETSPLRYQGLWRLTESVEPLRAQTYSRGIAYATGGDRSGWDITQLLRVPGTRNGKYDGVVVQVADVLYDEQKDLLAYDPSVFVLLNGQQSSNPGDAEALDLLAAVEELTPHTKQIRAKIPARILSLLSTHPSPTDDRSARLFEINCLLAEANFSPAEMYLVTQGCEWNKFVGRSDEQNYLAKDVLKAYNHVRDKKEAATKEIVYEKVSGSIYDEDPPARPDDHFISSEGLQRKVIEIPGWTIKDVVPKGEHTLLFGPEGCYKSYFALDMAISAATGTSSLGHFTAPYTQRVLLVQEEIQEWGMQDRDRRITLKKRVHYTSPGYNGESLNLKYLNNFGLDLTDSRDRDFIEAAVIQYRSEFIVLDPLYQIIGGADENKANEMSPITKWIKEVLIDQYKTTVVLVHHTNKMGDVSGTSLLKRWMGNSLSLSLPTGQQGIVQVKRKFRNYPSGNPFVIQWVLDPPGGVLYEPEVLEGSATDELLNGSSNATDPTYIRVKNVVWDAPTLDGESYAQLAKRAGMDEKIVRKYVSMILEDGLCRYKKEGGKTLVVPVYKNMGLTFGEESDDEDE